MSNIVYPNNLNGLGWSLIRRPTFDTTVRASKSQREVRYQNISETLMEFDLTYEFLSQTDMVTLLGLFCRMRGAYDTFYFDDPEDNTGTNVQIGTGNGLITDFTLQRSFGASTRVVDQVNAITQVTLNGTPTSAYTIVQPNIIRFTTAPGSGVIVRATFTYYWKVRFLQDSNAFEEFMQNMHQLRKVSFRSCRR
jgi:uncharacterized protein (TIGR02217 family)